MSRTEDNDELMDGIRKQLDEHRALADVDIKTLALLDISKSLAVIADGLREEEKDD